MRSRVWIIAVVLALLVVAAAGCGGDDDDSGGAATTAATTAETTEGGADGAAVFASNCGTCHTLAAAGSDGTTGPNLDDLKPDEETVEAQVRSGGGGMPAFEGQLSDDEIEAVATYVSESAGS
ncbi:MAG TPA: cytochrome c [Gaiellaceae bacterium]|nr:cytochrome c [Gaiellaceae bacterium]